MADDKGTLVVITQAVTSGVRAGPYRLEVFEGHRSKPAAEPVRTARAVLGSPSTFSLAPGKYTVRARNQKEGEFVEKTSVRPDEEALLPLLVGKKYAHDYNDLLVEMAPVQAQFESFMLDLGRDPKLQKKFLAEPDETLRDYQLAPSGGGLSRKNRLFLGLLANEGLRDIVRQGPSAIKVPSDFRKHHAPRLRRLLQKHVLDGQRANAELVDDAVRGRYFFQSVLTSVLTDPVLPKVYDRAFSRQEVDLLFDATYDFADFADPTDAAVTMAAPGKSKIAAVITFSIAQLKAGVGVNDSAAIFVNAGIFTKSTVFTNSRIFVRTKIVCKLSEDVGPFIGASEGYDLFDDHDVATELSDAFTLDDIHVNELSNYATLADAVVEGLNIMDYEKALEYARGQLRGE